MNIYHICIYIYLSYSYLYHIHIISHQFVEGGTSGWCSLAIKNFVRYPCTHKTTVRLPKIENFDLQKMSNQALLRALITVILLNIHVTPHSFQIQHNSFGGLKNHEKVYSLGLLQLSKI